MDNTISEAVIGDQDQYDRVAKIFHWLTVAFVVVQFALAELWDLLPRPEKHLMIVAHMSFGIILTVLLVGRMAWRAISAGRRPKPLPGLAGLASVVMHHTLYVLLVAQAVLGFVLRWSGDEAMSFFGLLIPPPFAPFSKPWNETIGDLHGSIGWAIVILGSCHGAAALFHHFVLRDNVLRRMLPEA